VVVRLGVEFVEEVGPICRWGVVGFAGRKVSALVVEMVAGADREWVDASVSPPELVPPQIVNGRRSRCFPIWTRDQFLAWR
jgi:hypothetical protein